MSAALPVPRYIRGDADATATQQAFNQFQMETLAYLSDSPLAMREGVRFTTPASGDAVVRLTTGLNKPARHVVCSWIERADGLAVGGPWSCCTTNISNTEVNVTFSGLTASVTYVVNFEVR